MLDVTSSANDTVCLNRFDCKTKTPIFEEIRKEVGVNSSLQEDARETARRLAPECAERTRRLSGDSRQRGLCWANAKRVMLDVSGRERFGRVTHATFLYLLDALNPKYGSVTKSACAIALAAGSSQRQAQRALLTLENARIISLLRAGNGRGHANMYVITALFKPWLMGGRAMDPRAESATENTTPAPHIQPENTTSATHIRPQNTTPVSLPREGSVRDRESCVRGAHAPTCSQPQLEGLELPVAQLTTPRRRRSRGSYGRRSGDGIVYEPAFETLWQAYPQTSNRSDKRQVAELAWRIVHGGIDDDDGRMIRITLPELTERASVHAQAMAKRDPQYVPSMQRWLKNRSFLGARSTDRPPAKLQAWWKDRALVAAISDDEWKRRIDPDGDGHWNIREAGPNPRHPDCVVPRHLVEELALTEQFDRHGNRQGATGHDR